MLRNEFNSNLVAARKFKLPAMLAILLFILGTLYVGHQAYLVNEQVGTVMLRKGWGKVTGSTVHENPVLFMFKCSGDGRCNQVYNDAFVHIYPMLPLYIFLGTFILMLLIVPKMHVQGNRKSPGVGSWGKKDELKEYITKAGLPVLPKARIRTRLPIRPIDENDGTRAVGYYGLLEDGTMLLGPEHLRNSHNAAIGGPGARKSTGYHKPNMLLDALLGNTCITFDSKYPDARAGFSDMIIPFHYCGRKVQVFTPFEFNTLRLDILGGVSSMDEALEIAELLIPEKQQEDGASFYRGIERQILARLLYAVALGHGVRSLRQVYQLLLKGRTEILKFIKTHPEQEIRSGANVLEEADARQLNGVIMNLMNKLIIFNNPMLDRATTFKEGEMLDLKGAFQEPTLLYFAMPEDKLRGVKGRVVMQLLKRMVDQALMAVAVEHGGILPLHANFYLDEFANMGVIPDIEKNLATMRSRRVSYHITLQNRAQGKAVYGEAVFNSIMDNNINHFVVFPRFLGTKDERFYWAEMVGKTTVIDQSEGESSESILGLKTGKRVNKTHREVERFLLQPEEMRTFPKDMAVMFSIGNKPVKVLMPRLDEARIGKIKNPLHYYHKWFFKGVNLQKEVTSIIDGLKLSDYKGEPEELLQGSTIEGVLQEWIAGILNLGVVVEYYRQDKQINKIRILKKSMDPSLQDQKLLDLLRQHDLIREEDDHLVILNKALKMIGETRVAELKNLYHKGRVLLWIRENGRHLEGHPDFALNLEDEQEREKLLGTYSDYQLTINKTASRELFGRTISNAKVRRMGSKDYNEILYHDVRFLAVAFGEEDHGEDTTGTQELDTLLQEHPTQDIEEAKKRLLENVLQTPEAKPQAAPPAPPTQEPTQQQPPKRKSKPASQGPVSQAASANTPEQPQAQQGQKFISVSQRLNAPQAEEPGKKWTSASDDTKK